MYTVQTFQDHQIYYGSSDRRYSCIQHADAAGKYWIFIHWKVFYNPFSVSKTLDIYHEAAHLDECGGKYLLSSLDGFYLNADISRALNSINNSLFILEGRKTEERERTVEGYVRLNSAVEYDFIENTENTRKWKIRRLYWNMLTCSFKILIWIHVRSGTKPLYPNISECLRHSFVHFCNPPKVISDGRFYPVTDTDLLFTACKDGDHLTSGVHLRCWVYLTQKSSNRL